MAERLHFHFSLSCIGEGNGNPRQCSCLENPRDGGAWWAAVYGVAQSRTRLKQLSMPPSTLWWSHKLHWVIAASLSHLISIWSQSLLGGQQVLWVKTGGQAREGPLPAGEYDLI